MTTLYILELTCGKWLVGETKDFDHTYTYYEIGFGTQWVRTCLLYTSPSPRD